MDEAQRLRLARAWSGLGAALLAGRTARTGQSGSAGPPGWLAAVLCYVRVVLDSALGSLSDRQDRCSKQQLSGYHVLNYYCTNHSYKALQNVGKQDPLCVPIHLYGWEEDRGPFRALEKFRKKKCVTQTLWRLRMAYRSHSTPWLRATVSVWSGFFFFPAPLKLEFPLE